MPRRLLKNRTIDVILLESNKHLGEKYEVVSVKPIFARNVLLPKGIAVVATADMLHRYQHKMAKAKQDINKKKERINDFLNTIINDGPVIISGKVNENGVLYAKIHAEEVAEAIIRKYNQELDLHFIKMKKITSPGEYPVTYKYKEVEKVFTVLVKAQEEEKKENPKKSGGKKEEVAKEEEKKQKA